MKTQMTSDELAALMKKQRKVSKSQEKKKTVDKIAKGMANSFQT